MVWIGAVVYSEARRIDQRYGHLVADDSTSAAPILCWAWSDEPSTGCGRDAAAAPLLGRAWSGLLQQGLHLLNLGLLGGDDLLGQLARGGVDALGQLGLGHVHRTLMMGDHHLEEHPVECGSAR